MQTTEGLRILGAAAMAIAAAFILRARRNARREAEREEETQSCVAHFQTLAVGLQSYRQDHGGELPRKFLCPPNDRRLASGWSEVSPALKGRGTSYDPLCPSGGGGP